MFRFLQSVFLRHTRLINIMPARTNMLIRLSRTKLTSINKEHNKTDTAKTVSVRLTKSNSATVVLTAPQEEHALTDAFLVNISAKCLTKFDICTSPFKNIH